MATIVRHVRNLPAYLPHGTAPKRGIKGLIVDKGERYGAMYAFGFGKTYFGESFIWKGHGADLWLGIGSLLVSTLLSLFTNGRSRLSSHLERIGDAGVMSAIGSLSAAHGADKAGVKVAVTKPRLPGKSTVLGGIAPAKAGPYLSPEAVMNFAARR